MRKHQSTKTCAPESAVLSRRQSDAGGLSVTFDTRPGNLGVTFTYDLAPLISRATGM